jgi:hypothetical protein
MHTAQSTRFATANYVLSSFAGVAQLVEQRICNPLVVGSNPITSFMDI